MGLRSSVQCSPADAAAQSFLRSAGQFRDAAGKARRRACGVEVTWRLHRLGGRLVPSAGELYRSCAEVSRIVSDFEKCFCTGAEQQIVDDFLVLQSQWSELRRKCEDHMDVARREKFSLTCGDPAFPGRGLTLRAVSVAAAVVGDGGTMPAAGALIEMTAECGGATARNGQQHFDMLPAEPLAISFDESSSRAADEIGHLQRWPAHLLFQLQ